VAALPDLGQSQAAAAALEAAAANNSNGGGAGPGPAAPSVSGGGDGASEDGSGVSRRGAGGWRLAPDAQVQGVLPTRNSPGSAWWSSTDLETRGRSNAGMAGVQEQEEAQLAAALALSLQQAKLDEERRARLRSEALVGEHSREVAVAGERGAGGLSVGGGVEGGGRVSGGSAMSSSGSRGGEQQEERRPTSAIPRSSQEEEEMLAMALALSLQEVKVEGAFVGPEVSGSNAVPGPTSTGMVPPDPVMEAAVPAVVAAARSGVKTPAAASVGGITKELGPSKSSTSSPRSQEHRDQAGATGSSINVGVSGRMSGSGGSVMVQRTSSGGVGAAGRQWVSPRQLQQHVQQQQQQGTSPVAPATGIAVAHMPRRQTQQQQQQEQVAAGGVGVGPLGLGAAGHIEHRKLAGAVAEAGQAEAPSTGAPAAGDEEGVGQVESPGAAVDVDVLPAGAGGGAAGIEPMGAVGKVVRAAEAPQQLVFRKCP
jgi:hypothetical protein